MNILQLRLGRIIPLIKCLFLAFIMKKAIKKEVSNNFFPLAWQLPFGIYVVSPKFLLYICCHPSIERIFEAPTIDLGYILITFLSF